MSEPKSYLALAPIRFNRLHGPWPPVAGHGGSAKEQLEAISYGQVQALRQAGVFQWYRTSTGRSIPVRRKKAGPFPFGAVPLRLTGPEARQFRQEFPDLHLQPNLTVRLPRRRRSLVAEGAGIGAGAPAWHLERIGVLEARQQGWASMGGGVGVAVVDSGIDHALPEFQGRIFQSAAYDPISGAYQGDVQQPSGYHGTHIAALIGGQDFGVAPAVDLVDVQVFRDGSAEIVAVKEALFFAAASPGVQIINLSAGWPGSTDAFETVVNQILMTGKLLVCAAGNRGAGNVDSPANYDAVLTVGAIDEADQVAATSGSGQITTPSGEVSLPDVVAPGVLIESAQPGGGSFTDSGTSQAAAIVSGLAALRLADRQGNLSLADLMSQIVMHTRTIPDSRAGHGAVFYNRLP